MTPSRTRLPILTESSRLCERLEQLFATPIPDKIDQEHVRTALVVAEDESALLMELLRRLEIVDASGAPSEIFHKLAKSRLEAKGELAEALVKTYAPLFGQEPNAHRLEPPALDQLVARLLGLHEQHATVRETRDTFLALVDFTHRRNIDNPAGGGVSRFKAKGSLLAFLAKWTSLAVLILLVGSIYELLLGSPLGHDRFQSGLAFAYIGAISVIIAFSRGKSLQQDLQRGAIFTLAGIAVWTVFDLHERDFEVVAAVCGIWYAVMLRRL